MPFVWSLIINIIIVNTNTALTERLQPLIYLFFIADSPYTFPSKIIVSDDDFWSRTHNFILIHISIHDNVTCMLHKHSAMLWNKNVETSHFVMSWALPAYETVISMKQQVLFKEKAMILWPFRSFLVYTLAPECSVFVSFGRLSMPTPVSYTHLN